MTEEVLLEHMALILRTSDKTLIKDLAHDIDKDLVTTRRLLYLCISKYKIRGKIKNGHDINIMFFETEELTFSSSGQYDNVKDHSNEVPPVIDWNTSPI